MRDDWKNEAAEPEKQEKFDPFKKNGNTGQRGRGRKKGALNKMTRALKDMILGALDEAGGQAYLARQAEETPAAFIALLGKVLPSTLHVSGEGGGAIQVEHLSDDELRRKIDLLLSRIDGHS